MKATSSSSHASRVTRHASVILACAFAAGCWAPRESFLGKRWMDFADCWDVSAGVAGPVPYLRLKVTDYFVVGAGDNQTLFALGWHGRYTAAATELERGHGVPFVRNEEWAGAPPMIRTKGPFTTTREYDASVKPAPGTQRAERYYLGLWLAWLVNVRLNFNPVEFADFFAGWFKADMLKDDGVEPPSWGTMVRTTEKP